MHFPEVWMPNGPRSCGANTLLVLESQKLEDWSRVFMVVAPLWMTDAATGAGCGLEMLSGLVSRPKIIVLVLVLAVWGWSLCGTSCFSFELEVVSSQLNSYDSHTVLKTYWLNCYKTRVVYLQMLESSALVLIMVLKTSPGSDNIPYWFLKHCAMELTPVVTHCHKCAVVTARVRFSLS